MQKIRRVGELWALTLTDKTTPAEVAELLRNTPGNSTSIVGFALREPDYHWTARLGETLVAEDGNIARIDRDDFLKHYAPI